MPGSGIPYPSVIMDVTPDGLETIRLQELKGLWDRLEYRRRICQGERLMADHAAWAVGYTQQARRPIFRRSRSSKR